MNILMVSNEFPPSIGGVQTHVYELSKALVELGHSVHVLTRRKSPDLAAEEDLHGVRVFRYPLQKNHLIYNLQLHRLLKRHLQQDDIQIVHIHGMRPLQAARGVPAPVFFTNHTSSFLRRSEQGVRTRKKMARQLRVASMVLAPSPLLAERTRKTGYAGPVRFITNGVDIAKFTPGLSPLRSRLGIPDGAFVAVMAGRLHAVKGPQVLAKALQGLDNPELHLVVAGDGEERAIFESMIRQCSCEKRVHMLGAVANEAMPEIYRGADVMVLPSLMEATSIAGLEAMACGLPLIASRVGGLPVIVKHEVNGLLVEPQSPEDLKTSLCRLMNDRGLARQLGQASLKRARNEFSWRGIAQRTVEAYQNILSH